MMNERKFSSLIKSSRKSETPRKVVVNEKENNDGENDCEQQQLDCESMTENDKQQQQQSSFHHHSIPMILSHI